MTKTVRNALMGAAVAALLAPPALAQQTCRDMADRFAAAENLSATSPPTATPPAPGDPRPGTAGTSDGGSSGLSMSDKLGQSGGVLKPPAIGDQAVIDPPQTGNMPTAPRVAPAPGAGSSAGSPTGASPDRAAQRAQMEALVTAARAAAERGDERQCMDSLSKAQALTGGRGSGGGG
ncbi:hypothetical protein [Azospirillum sp. TSO22-1]|uniref:hypothetical protein n=1 Tax=Azospirillum sp. TSO22-1 TaxID=716789 RepID=UPI000D611081|nr:hypothetical protein [Azospirillum sp. TSO22-1]PWC41423.1 hypothetical protein TSO221_23400 [Azospirillum sp. TSO22-1]